MNNTDTTAPVAMNTRLTPLHLKLLLHAFTMAEPWPHKEGCAAEYEGDLADAGLIERHEDLERSMWVCTDKGKAHVEQLLALQFPTQAWISASGEVLKIR